MYLWLEYVLCCTLNPLVLPSQPWLCEFNEGCVVVGVVSYLSLIFQLSAVVLLVYYFPDVVWTRVPQRLLPRAGISFSEGCGSSGAGLQLLLSRSAFRLQGGTFVVRTILKERFVSPEHLQHAGRNVHKQNETRSMFRALEL